MLAELKCSPQNSPKMEEASPPLLYSAAYQNEIHKFTRKLEINSFNTCKTYERKN